MITMAVKGVVGLGTLKTGVRLGVNKAGKNLFPTYINRGREG